MAQVFCKKLCEVMGLPPQRLYLVAGNHDVNRIEVKNSHLKRWYPFETQDDITEVMMDPDMFPTIMRKFSEFNHFAEEAMGRDYTRKKPSTWWKP